MNDEVNTKTARETAPPLPQLNGESLTRDTLRYMAAPEPLADLSPALRLLLLDLLRGVTFAERLVVLLHEQVRVLLYERGELKDEIAQHRTVHAEVFDRVQTTLSLAGWPNLPDDVMTAQAAAHHLQQQMVDAVTKKRGVLPCGRVEAIRAHGAAVAAPAVTGPRKYRTLSEARRKLADQVIAAKDDHPNLDWRGVKDHLQIDDKRAGRMGYRLRELARARLLELGEARSWQKKA